MPRYAREKCDSGTYHIMLRGINREDIFLDEEDKQRFLEILVHVKDLDNFEVYAYCLMTNHVHLLIHEKKDDLSRIMKRIGVRYAWWYNWKYKRVGHVFQDRFRSESINDDAQLLSVVRYIHNNPIEAKMVNKAEEYKWCSCRIYFGAKESITGLTNTDFILGMFSDVKAIAINKLMKFSREKNEDKFLDLQIKIRKTDEDLLEEIVNILNGRPIGILQTTNKDERDKILRVIKEIEGASQRQISRVTGISQSTISMV